MKFLSYDVIEGVECVTEVRPADQDAAREFSRTWDPYVDEKIVTDRDFHYRIFEWDMLIHIGLTGEFDYRCFAAYTGARLDGLLSLRKEEKFYLDFVSTAPWNYGHRGRMRRIGSGLVYFTIQTSIEEGLDGAFHLFAVEDSEPYFERIGMAPTGCLKYGLREYHMPEERAASFMEGFQIHVAADRDEGQKRR